MRRALLRGAVAAVPAAFLGYFFLWPLAAILGRGLVPHGHVHIAPLLDVLGQPRTRAIVWFTLWQAIASTAITVAVGLPAAFVLYRLQFRGATSLRALVVVPFVLPTVVAAAAFRSLLGTGGAFARWHLVPGIAAILLAHVFFNVAVVVRIVGARWANLDPRTEDAARVLGASPRRAFALVTLPALAPAILAASAIVFLFCFTSFGVVLVLGGLTRSTIETEIYRVTVEQLALDRAGALVVFQLLTIAAVLLVTGRLERGTTVARRLVAAPQTARRVRSRSLRALVAAVLAVLGVLIVVPIGWLAIRSTAGSLAGYRAFARTSTLLGSRPIDAVAWSLRDAVLATALAVVVGGLASFAVARRRRGAGALNALALLPLGVSAVTVGYGFLIALDRPIDLRARWWLVPVAHATVALPFVLRSVVPALRAIDPHLRDAATTLGASPARVWREVDLAIARRALAVAAGFAAAVSLGEFGATAFVARADAPTVPLAIVRLLGRPGTLGVDTANALATTLVVLTGTVVLLVDRLRPPGRAEF